MAEHTELPWGIMNDAVCRKKAYAGTVAEEAAPGITIGSPANTEPICRVSGYLQPLEANAAYIVLAANSHHRLVEALEAAFAELIDCQREYDQNFNNGELQDEIQRLRAVLADIRRASEEK